MNDMRYAAQALAAKGRFGDTMLLHVNPAEVAGIASLVPGGLTTNPVTGLPEAFFFLPFLATLFGGGGAAAAGLGAAAAGATAAAAAAPALTAGLAAGAGAASAAAPILAAAAPAAGLLTGGAAALPAAGLAAAAAPAAASGGLGSLLGGATGAAGANLAATLPAAASAVPAASGLASLTAPVAESASLLGGSAGTNALLGAGTDAITTGGLTIHGPSLAGQTVLGGGSASTGLAIPPTAGETVLAGANTGLPTPISSGPAVLSGPKTGIAIGPPTPGVAGQTVLGGGSANTGVGINAATTPPPPGSSIFGGIGDLIKSNPMMAMMLAQQGMSALGSMFKDDDDDDSDYKEAKYEGGGVTPAPAGFQHGKQGEHLFFRKPGYGYANGGIVGLAGGGMPPVDPQAQMPQDMGFPLNDVPGGGGIADLAGGPEEIPTSPFPTEQIGSEPEPDPNEDVAVNTENDQELVMQMVEVIQGQHPEPEPVIKAFVQEFGEQAMQDLVQRVKGMASQPPAGPAGPPPGLMPGGPSPMDQMPPMPPMGPPPGGAPQQFAFGGPVGGMGDGLSDSVPAMIDGRQPAALSRGEFVIPADAVSGLGNGSTDAGAEQLQGMVNNVRMARGGTVGQAPPIQGGIAAMMAGGLV